MTTYRPGIALSGDNIVLTAADFVVAVDRRSGAMSWKHQNAALHQYYSPPVVDPEGNIYVTLDSSVEVVDPSGKARMLLGFQGTSGPSNTEFGVFSQEVIMSPDGVLFHQSNDGTLRAIAVSTGTEQWSVPKAPWRPSAGAAGTFIVGPDLREAATGRVLGQLIASNGTQLWMDSQVAQGTVLAFGGFLGRSYEKSEPDLTRVEALDPCDAPRWNIPSTEGDLEIDAVGFGDIVYITAVPRGSNDPSSVNRVFGVRPDGTKVGGMVTTPGRVVAIGADDTVYTRDCSANSSSGNLIALDRELTEKWRLAIPGACGNTNVVLTDDGMLYFARHASPGATEIVAVQTSSPGLARSAWPTWRHDNRATAWLSP